MKFPITNFQLSIKSQLFNYFELRNEYKLSFRVSQQASEKSLKHGN